MTSSRVVVAALISFFTLGCASGALRIVESGFTAVETAPTQFAIKLESDQIRSDEELEANLLVHSARWTIDHSGFFFTISDRVRGQESEIDLEQDSREEGGTGVPTITQGGTGGYTSAAVGKRVTTRSLRATLRIYRDRPEDAEGTVFEAIRVLERYSSVQRSSSVRAGGGAGARP